MKPEVKAKLLKGLRSGKYKSDGTIYLKKSKNCGCIHGIAALILLGEDAPELAHGKNFVTHGGMDRVREVMEMPGMEFYELESVYYAFMKRNRLEHQPTDNFEHIANWIEENL